MTREEQIRNVHKNHREMWGDKATSFCADCYLLSLLDAARAESEALREALIWCSGSPSFQPEGEAREGWVTICQPLLAARDGAPT